MSDGLHADVPIATSLATFLATRRSLLLAREVMVLVSRVTVHGQSWVRRLAAGRLVSRRERRRSVVMSTGYAVLKPRVVLRPFRRVLGVAGRQMGRLLRTAQRMIGVMQSSACRRAIIASDAQWRGAVLYGGGRTVPGRAGIGQRTRTAHLTRCFPVDVGEAFSYSSVAMGQEPNTAGSGARRPEF